MKEHWAQPFLPASIVDRKRLTGGCQHQTDYIELVDQTRWVCKKMSRESWLGPVTEAQLVFMQQLDLYLTSHAFQAGQDYQFIQLPDRTFGIILAYQEGSFFNTLTNVQAHLLGSKLAELHQLSRNIEGALPFPKIELLTQSNTPHWIVEWIIACNQKVHSHKKDWVIGHRDLNLSNIIWNAQKTPVFIDWESAGWIHPTVDLIGLALNCSLSKKGIFNKKNFQAVLLGYRKRFGSLPSDHDDFWVIIGHSWLLWYRYTSILGWSDQAEQCMETLEQLKSMQPALRQLYGALK